jgi:hypothetical protein
VVWRDVHTDHGPQFDRYSAYACINKTLSICHSETVYKNHTLSKGATYMHFT